MFHQSSDHIYSTLLSSSFILLTTLTYFNSLVEGSAYSSMQKLKIPADLIPTIDAYTQTVKIQLNGNDVKPGDPVPARSFKTLDLSKISWEANDDAKYTIMLLDLDRKPNATAPSIYNLYTSINAPANLISSSQTLVAFDPPNVSCHPSMKHRLVLLVYRQSESIDLPSIVTIAVPTGYSEKRENFNLLDFMTKHRLTLVAANVFTAIGETGGVCSGSLSISQRPTFSLLQMVILLAAIMLAQNRATKLLYLA